MWLLLGRCCSSAISPFGIHDKTVVPRSIGFIVIAISIVLSLVTCLKGKLTLGLISIFVPPVGLVTALRLARPGSVWAQLFYSATRQAERCRGALPPGRLEPRAPAAPRRRPGRGRPRQLVGPRACGREPLSSARSWPSRRSTRSTRCCSRSGATRRRPSSPRRRTRRPEIYERDFEEFWERRGRASGSRWFEPFDEALRVGAAVRQVVPRRQAERLPTTASTATSRRAAATRSPTTGRASPTGERRDDHLRRAPAGGRRAARTRCKRARGDEGHAGRDLHGDGPRAARRDARLRAARRAAHRRLRRLLGRRRSPAGSSDMGCEVLITQDEAWRRGATVPLKATADEAMAARAERRAPPSSCAAPAARCR